MPECFLLYFFTHNFSVMTDDRKNIWWINERHVKSSHYSPNEHSSPIRWGLKHASLLWYDDLHQAQDRATISFELNDNFACNDCEEGEKRDEKFR